MSTKIKTIGLGSKEAEERGIIIRQALFGSIVGLPTADDFGDLPLKLVSDEVPGLTLEGQERRTSLNLQEVERRRIVQAAINQSADVNAQDNYGMTALMYAARWNHKPEVIMTLLKAGGDAKAKDKWGMTAFDYAQGNEKLKGTLGSLDRPAALVASDHSYCSLTADFARSLRSPTSMLG